MLTLLGAAASMLQDEPSGGAAAAFGMVFFVVWLAIVALVIAGFWKVFVKAGEPGWACLIPIYNSMVMAKIGGKPSWWGIVITFVPCVNIVMSILVALGTAENFGKGAGYGLGLAFLGPIFYPMLAFSDAQFTGTKGE